MKFFVDTADINEIRDLAEKGLLDGVTTNPSLIAKAGRNFIEEIREICAIVKGPVSAEVSALDAETMIAEGHKLAEIADNVTVKVPMTWDGLKACRTLSQAGIMVNVTLCFSANQALLAAKAAPPSFRRSSGASTMWAKTGWLSSAIFARSSIITPITAPRSLPRRCAIRGMSRRPRWRAPMWRPFRLLS